MEGEAKSIHLGVDFEGDIIINLTPQIGIGFGTGYIQGVRTSEIISSGSVEGICTYTSKIRAIPFRIGVFYTLPMSKRMNAVFNAGVGIYLAQCNYDWNSRLRTGFLQSNQESSSAGFGFHGGVGFEFKIASNFSFVFEGQGRYARIGKFEGTNRYPPSGIKEGTLYYYELTTPRGKYSWIDIKSREPSGPGYSNVREAKVDFSGITFFTGIKINF